jgi:hypothetical protein
MYYLVNAFSLQMLPDMEKGAVLFRKLSAKEFIDYYILHLSPVADKGEVINVIGHPATDALLREFFPLSLPPAERKSIQLQRGDILLVVQYTGGRLPVGEELEKVSLDDFTFYLVSIVTPSEIARECDMVFQVFERKEV